MPNLWYSMQISDLRRMRRKYGKGARGVCARVAKALERRDIFHSPLSRSKGVILKAPQRFFAHQCIKSLSQKSGSKINFKLKLSLNALTLEWQRLEWRRLRES